jgi:signal transduction histidine kinase
MKKPWLQFETWPRQVVVLVCICLVILVGYIDYLTGYETFCFTFYLLGILLGTWRAGAAFGALMAALSVTAWISANVEAGEHYSSYFVPVWNAMIMFTVYLIIVLLLARLKKTQEDLEERVRLRTVALTREIQQRVSVQKELLETTDREQRRIGRDLHDGLCQHLTGIALAGHLLEQKLSDQSATGAAEAARVVKLIEEGIEMTRDLSQQLHPVELSSGRLGEHLASLAAETGRRFNVACRVNSHLDRAIDDPVLATHLYRIAQDALAGAVARGDVKQINIELESNAFEIKLTISDDGTNEPQKQSEAMSRHRIMAHRADLMGAHLHIGPATSKGTCVTCALRVSGAKNGGEN